MTAFRTRATAFFVAFLYRDTKAFVSRPTNKRDLACHAANGDWVTRSESIARVLAYPVGFAASFRIGAAASVIGQPRMPEAEIPVGSTIARLPSTGARVRLFYPCEAGRYAEAAYCTDGRATSDGMAGLVGFRQLGLSFLLAHLADASSGCLLDAPVVGSKLPLLVYSHGYGGNMDMGTYFLRAIAAKGIVVAAIEHTDGTASSTVLSDGSRKDFGPMAGRASLSRRADEVVEAARYLPTLYNTEKIFFGGHSYGATSAILAAQRSPSLASGLLLHDPALGMGYGMIERSPPASIPTVSYTSDEYNRGGVKYGDFTFHVRGAFHGNFVDAPLWAPLWVMRPLSAVIPACGPADPVEVHQQLAESARVFVAGRSAADANVGTLFETV